MPGELKWDNNKNDFMDWCVESRTILINEAVTDFWAITFHTSLLCYLTDSLFESMLKIEIDHIFSQAKKISFLMSSLLFGYATACGSSL